MGRGAFADYVIPVLRQIPNSQHSITNRYLDVFARGGEWRILHRQTAREALREHVTPTSTRGLPPDHPSRGLRAPKDAVYRGAAIADDPIVPVPVGDFWAAVRARHTRG